VRCVVTDARLVLRLVSVPKRARSRWLHYAACLYAGFSVWANWALTESAGSWRVVFAAMPCVWLVGVEALRYFWRLRNTTEARTGIPRGRWIAAPISSAKLLRRMLLQNVTDYGYAFALHNATQLARDLVVARGPWDKAPALLRRQISEWDVPCAVHSTIKMALAVGSVPDVEPAINEWVTVALTSRDRHAVAMASARSAIAASGAGDPAPDVASDAAADAAPKAARTRTPNYARKPSPKAVKSMDGQALAPYVEAWLQTPDGKPTIAAVGGHFRVGNPKAKAALEALGLYGVDPPVIELGAR